MDWLVGILLIAVALICRLVMIFMMRGMHGGHGGRSASQDGLSDEQIAEREQQVKRIA